MRILFVAFQNSIHTARWISQLENQEWQIHLFPSSIAGDPHPILQDMGVSFHLPKYVRIPMRLYQNRIKKRNQTEIAQRFSEPNTLSVLWLKNLIRRLRPDIVHSLEIQHAGYLTLEVKKQLGDEMPIWMVGNWGSDIYLFGRLALHSKRIKEVLRLCDYYSCECERDISLAKDYGLRGKPTPVLPNAGGFNLTKARELHAPGKVSSRRTIILKGYQGWAGRALVGLRAIELCTDELVGYRVVIPLADPEVELAAEVLAQRSDLSITVLPRVSHEEMLKIYGDARIYLGLSISDAISQSMLESIVMGAFPIQSSTSCANEWIRPGISGLIVPPEDPRIIANALRRALTDDELVDSAAKANWRMAKNRLDEEILRPRVFSMYEEIFEESRII